MQPIRIPATKNREQLTRKSNEELVDLVLRQQEVIQQLQATIQQISEEIERLKNRETSDSRSSSKPPSSDIHKRSEQPPSPKPKQGKRRPGAQPGHAGKTRQGFGRIDRQVVVPPETCSDCGGTIFTNPPVRVRTYTVAELADPAIEIVSYEQHCCECETCGREVWGTLPPGVIGTQSLGARLQALLVWLGNYGHLSYEKQQELLLELGQIKVGTGTLQATNVRLSEAAQAAVNQLGLWIRDCEHVQADETPWLVKGVKEWMWVICGLGFCVFHAGDTRSRAELEILLGKSFAGVLSSDDFSVYNGYPVRAQQKCLAHLRRHFKKVIKLKHGNNPQLGQVFLDLIDAAFEAHRQWRETQDESAYRNWVAGFKLDVKMEIEHWLPKAGYAAGLLLRSLRKKEAQWWYFLDHPEVPPDNNRSERFLRLAVTKRKVCGGSRSMEGFAQTAILLTVIQTCRAQRRSAFEFFNQALISTHLPEIQPMPSLIPENSP